MAEPQPVENGLINTFTNEDMKMTHNPNLMSNLRGKIKLLFYFIFGGDHKFGYFAFTFM